MLINICIAKDTREINTTQTPPTPPSIKHTYTQMTLHKRHYHIIIN